MAAAAGAVVAFCVVRLTNAQQQHGVDRTIEVAAIGEVVASASHLEWAIRYKMPSEPLEFDSGMHILPMRAAVARIKMARPESHEIADIIELWPDRIHNLVIHYQISKTRNLGHSREVMETISNIVTGIQLALPMAVLKSSKQRSAARRHLRAVDTKIMNAMSTFEHKLSDNLPETPLQDA